MVREIFNKLKIINYVIYLKKNTFYTINIKFAALDYKLDTCMVKIYLAYILCFVFSYYLFKRNKIMKSFKKYKIKEIGIDEMTQIGGGCYFFNSSNKTVGLGMNVAKTGMIIKEITIATASAVIIGFERAGYTNYSLFL